MTLYALDDIDDAIGATRALLWPFDLGRWAKLALVMFFIGGTGGFNPLQFGSSGTPSSGGPETPATPGIPESISSIGGPETTVIAAIFSLIVLLGLAFMLVGSIMEFVFVKSLQREAVTIRRYWSEHWRQGLRLFGFRLVVGVLTLGLFGLLIVVISAPVIFGDGNISPGLVLVAIPVGIVIAILSGLVAGFTTTFVVPIMIVEKRGLISSWRRFWPTMTGQWKQYLVYVVMNFIFQIAGGLAATIATAIAAIVVAIPLVIVGLLGAGLLTISQTAGWAIIAIAVALFVIALLILVLFTSVPIQTFLRYYALLVLGDTNEAFDLISGRRQTIRA